ncbi:MAG: hypothetical protein PWP11_2403 [Thauera sp.]|nr:NusG domain II-containing protein [Thauera sp.]MDI3491126.1 hypothetical protein [Thauera sp.]
MSLAPAAWRALLRPGDVLVVLGGLLLCGYSLMVLWQGGRPDAAIVRAGGKVVAEVDLRTVRIIDVPGPIGTTRIEIQPGRARVAADPGPRQYCVRQGWLTQAGAVAICAPNEVSLSLSGRGADYDSLNY